MPDPEFRAIRHQRRGDPRVRTLRRPGRERTKPKTKAKRDKPKRRDEPTFDAGDTLAYDDDVISWVRDRVRRGWTRQEISPPPRPAPTAGPRPGRTISSERDFGELRLAIYYIETERANRRRPAYPEVLRQAAPRAARRAARERRDPTAARTARHRAAGSAYSKAPTCPNTGSATSTAAPSRSFTKT